MNDMRDYDSDGSLVLTNMTILPTYADPYAPYTFSKMIGGRKRVLIHEGTSTSATGTGYIINFMDPVSGAKMSYTDKTIAEELIMEMSGPDKIKFEEANLSNVIPMNEIMKEPETKNMVQQNNIHQETIPRKIETEIISEPTKGRFSDIIERSKKEIVTTNFSLEFPKLDFIRILLDNLDLDADEQVKFMKELNDYALMINMNRIKTQLQENIRNYLKLNSVENEEILPEELPFLNNMDVYENFHIPGAVAPQ